MLSAVPVVLELTPLSVSDLLMGDDSTDFFALRRKMRFLEPFAGVCVFESSEAVFSTVITEPIEVMST